MKFLTLYLILSYVLMPLVAFLLINWLTKTFGDEEGKFKALFIPLLLFAPFTMLVVIGFFLYYWIGIPVIGFFKGLYKAFTEK